MSSKRFAASKRGRHGEPGPLEASDDPQDAKLRHELLVICTPHFVFLEEIRVDLRDFKVGLLHRIHVIDNPEILRFHDQSLQ